MSDIQMHESPAPTHSRPYRGRGRGRGRGRPPNLDRQLAPANNELKCASCSYNKPLDQFISKYNPSRTVKDCLTCRNSRQAALASCPIPSH